MAQTQFEEETSSKGLQVKVLFWPHVRISKADQRPASLELCRIVKDAFPLGTTEAFSKRLGLHDDDFESDYFQTLYLHYHPLLAQAHWQLAEAHPVSLLTADEIQGEIDKKEDKVAQYRKQAPVCWLLISTNGFEAPPAKSVDDSILARVYRSSFDGVVLFDELMERAYRLRVAAGPAPRSAPRI